MCLIRISIGASMLVISNAAGGWSVVGDRGGVKPYTNDRIEQEKERNERVRIQKEEEEYRRGYKGLQFHQALVRKELQRQI